MATNRAIFWAYFLKRLGFSYSKASIMRFADSNSDAAVWAKYIANNPLALEACKESHIKKPEDIWWLAEQISYTAMRKSYPPRSHGRGILGPKIVPMSSVQLSPKPNDNIQITSCVNKAEKAKKPILISSESIGKRVIHITFGEGTIIDVKEENRIIVEFDSCGIKYISYEYCLENGFISFR